MHIYSMQGLIQAKDVRTMYTPQNQKLDPNDNDTWKCRGAFARNNGMIYGVRSESSKYIIKFSGVYSKR